MDRSATILRESASPGLMSLRTAAAHACSICRNRRFRSVQGAAAGQGLCDQITKVIQVIAHKLEQVAAHFQTLSDLFGLLQAFSKMSIPLPSNRVSGVSPTEWSGLGDKLYLLDRPAETGNRLCELYQY